MVGRASQGWLSKRVCLLAVASVLLVVLSVSAAGPPALAQVEQPFPIAVQIEEATINLNPQVVTVSGRVDCAEPVSFVEVFADVAQAVWWRPSPISGSGYAGLTECGPFTLPVEAGEGFFRPGQAAITVFAIACQVGEFGIEECASDEETEQVKLKPSLLGTGIK